VAHLQFIEDAQGDVVDYVVFCSDYCSRFHVAGDYKGWNGCHEIGATEPCAECGGPVAGLDEE
jgi:hypothetical protein